MTSYLVIADAQHPLLKDLPVITGKLGATHYYFLSTQAAQTQLTPQLLTQAPLGTELLFLDSKLQNPTDFEKKAVTDVKYPLPAWILISPPGRVPYPLPGTPQLSPPVVITSPPPPPVIVPISQPPPPVVITSPPPPPVIVPAPIPIGTPYHRYPAPVYRSPVRAPVYRSPARVYRRR